MRTLIIILFLGLNLPAVEVTLENISDANVNYRFDSSGVTGRKRYSLPPGASIVLNMPADVATVTVQSFRFSAGLPTEYDAPGNPYTLDFSQGACGILARDDTFTAYALAAFVYTYPPTGTGDDISGESADRAWKGFTVGLLLTLLPGTMYLVFGALRKGIKLTNESI